MLVGCSDVFTALQGWRHFDLSPPPPLPPVVVYSVALQSRSPPRRDSFHSFFPWLRLVDRPLAECHRCAGWTKRSLLLGMSVGRMRASRRQKLKTEMVCANTLFTHGQPVTRYWCQNSGYKAWRPFDSRVYLELLIRRVFATCPS